MSERNEQEPVRTNAARAAEICMKKARRKSDRIDECLYKARRLLAELEQQDDPYAMHKAIESLPMEVLISFAAKSAEHFLSRGE